MDNEDWDVVLESTHEAVCKFARVEYESLVRKAIYRLQRVNASGVFGDCYIYKTLWDEYCHEIQEGPHDLLENAWGMTIEVFLDDVVEQVPRHTAALLSIFAAQELDDYLQPEHVAAVSTSNIKRLLGDKLAESAGARPIFHLGPWRNS